MTRRDEISILSAQVVLDFAKQAAIEWDAVYFRFYSAEVDHSSFEFTYRKNRDLKLVRSTDEHCDLLEKLMPALFDEVQQETGMRPLVAVVEVRSENDYEIVFNYEDPDSLDISLTGLGTSASYFPLGTFDIPVHVKKFQGNLARQRLEELPDSYDPSQGA